MLLVGGPTPAHITSFAVLYCIGNALALLATGFLVGPRSQCRKMIDPTRRVSTAIYLSLLIIVFAVALAVSRRRRRRRSSCCCCCCCYNYDIVISNCIRGLSIYLSLTLSLNLSPSLSIYLQKQSIYLILFLLFLQILSGIWYSASYVPFGRNMIKTILKKTICKPCWDMYEEMKGEGGGGGGKGGFSSVSQVQIGQDRIGQDKIG